ncbi:MAG: RNA polymerase sigma-70 factor [Bacteroidales bacterium]|nr:RNA polymerase sigma-70 factor [Bacteroidales bacterium]
MKEHSINTDDDLIALLKKDDSIAFETLYLRYSDKLYYFAIRYLKSKEDAEGLVQDIFTKIWEIRKNLNSGQSFSSFLFTIAKNTIFNKHRKKLNENAYREHLRNYFDEVYDKTENDIILADMKARIDKSVEKFPPQRKLIYQLSREEGLSYKEIAEQLGISEKTIEAHIRLALKTLRSALSDEMLFPLFLSISILY